MHLQDPVQHLAVRVAGMTITFRPDQSVWLSYRPDLHETHSFFEHIRIASVARIEDEWIGFEPDVSKSGGLGTLVSAYQKGENHELLCVSRSA